MSFETLLVALALLVLFLLVGAYVRAVADRAYEKKARKLDNENVELRKKLAAIQFPQELVDLKKIDRFKVLANMKIKALIIDYVKWEKASNQVRLALGFATAFLLTILIANVAKDYNRIDFNNFLLLGLFLFGFSYLFWGGVLEVYWKTTSLLRIRQEWDDVLRYASDPNVELNNLIKWIQDFGVNDEVFDDLEETLRKRLKKMIEDELKK